MAGFATRGAPWSRCAPQATSNKEDGQLSGQPEGKSHILPISASLFLDVPLGTPSSSFLELNKI